VQTKLKVPKEQWAMLHSSTRNMILSTRKPSFAFHAQDKQDYFGNWKTSGVGGLKRFKVMKIPL